MPRMLVWFSCGAASAVAANETLKKFPNAEVLYNDTLAYEHPDNKRFISDCEKWLGKEIKMTRSEKYTDIYDVFNKTGWLVGPMGAACTKHLKQGVRKKYQRPDDAHVFGYTSDEKERADNMEARNPETKFYWPLIENKITKADCLQILKDANIEIPMMYKLGYKNNNCIGCVKGGMGYWNKIRKDFPEYFDRMARQERKMNVAICKRYEGKTRIKVFLDELQDGWGRYETEPDIECGPMCQMTFDFWRTTK